MQKAANRHPLLITARATAFTTGGVIVALTIQESVTQGILVTTRAPCPPKLVRAALSTIAAELALTGPAPSFAECVSSRYPGFHPLPLREGPH